MRSWLRFGVGCELWLRLRSGLVIAKVGNKVFVLSVAPKQCRVQTKIVVQTCVWACLCLCVCVCVFRPCALTTASGFCVT